MDVGERAELAGHVHGLDILRRELVEFTQFGHENLEAGMALRHQIAHFLNHLVVGAEQGWVQTIIDDSFIFGLGFPSFHRLHQSLSRRRENIIDHRRHAAARRLHGGGMKIVNGAFAHQFEIHMGVGIHAAWEKIFASDVDFSRRRAQFLADLFDLAAFDADICDKFLGMGDDGAVAQDEVQGLVSFP